MKPITELRFNALAGYAKDPRTPLYAEERAWFEHADERVLGLLIRDRADNDYGGMVFARDELQQYRWTRGTDFVASERRAAALLRPALEQAAMAPDEEHHQGHRNPKPVDFFAPVVRPERLNADFAKLVGSEDFSPARGIIEPMMRWYEDVDGNFIEQFQTTGFDARLWELYLFAAFSEAGLAFERNEVAPDYLVSGLNGRAAVEAVTINPTLDRKGKVVPPPPIETPLEIGTFLREYMPIKYGSALYSKLVREYWAKPHVRGLPFALAIQDFSAPGTMPLTRTPLQVYLYGHDHDWCHDETGKLIVTPRRVQAHRWREKEIPSGFFFLPGAENVSAVIFSNSGTISKFNRMGQLAGFGSKRVRMVRQGTAYDHNPDAAAPRGFRLRVDEPDYSETWIEGMDVYHNPRAVIPFPPALLPGAAHIRLGLDGQILADTPAWHPLGSYTFITIEGGTARTGGPIEPHP